MLPDIDADDGDVREERVLVRRGDDLEALGRRVKTLRAGLADINDSGGKDAERTSQPQPEPWILSVAALNSFLRLSSPPKSLSMACLSGPSLRTPPFPPLLEEGARFFQKSEWLICPASCPDQHPVRGQMKTEIIAEIADVIADFPSARVLS